MTYELRYHPAVLAFTGSLSQDDKEDVDALLESIADDPELGTPLDSVLYKEARNKRVFYRKTYGVNKQQFPKGLRIVYAVDRRKVIILVMDIGDHQNSVRFPGQSVYPDER